MPGAAKKEIVGRATVFRSITSLTDLAFGRISRSDYSSRDQQVVVRPVRVAVDVKPSLDEQKRQR